MSRSILSRFVAIFSSKVIELLAVFLATPVIVRVLGPSSYGDYAFLLSVLGVLMLFVDIGIFDGIRKFLIESDRPDEWQEWVFAFYVRVAMGLVAFVVVGVLLLVEFGVVARLFGARFDWYLLVLAGLILARQLGAVARSTLMGLNREDVSESLQIVNKLLFVGVGLGLLLAGYGIVGLLTGRIVGHVVMSLAGFAVVSRHLDFRYLARRVPDSFPATTLLRFNLGSFVLFTLYVSILHLDVLLIQWFRGSAATGMYRAALTLAEFLWVVPRIAQLTLLHSTSELWSKESHQRITALSTRVARYTLIFTTLLVVGLAALARPTVTTYYGPDFEAAVLPLLILLPGALGFAVARPIFAIGQANGDFRQLNLATGSAALLNLFGNLLLIPRYGIEGAAVATSASYLSMLGLHVWSARSIGFYPATDLRLARIALTATISAVPIFLLASIISSDLLALLIVPPVGFLVYAATSVLSGAIDLDELSEVRQQVR